MKSKNYTIDMLPNHLGVMEIKTGMTVNGNTNTFTVIEVRENSILAKLNSEGALDFRKYNIDIPFSDIKVMPVPILHYQSDYWS
jgi:hypothetical protein